MNLLDLEDIHKNHRKELENRLTGAMSTLKNLDRMAQECFDEIDKRAQADVDQINNRATEAKNNFSIIFMSLTKAEEFTIELLRKELGLDNQLPAVVQLYETDNSDLSQFHVEQPKADKSLEKGSLFDRSNNNLPHRLTRNPNKGKKNATI